MGWFRKKPSVQETRLTLGLISGNPAAIHRYVPVFLDAINGAAMYREPSEIADDMGIGTSATPAQEAVLLGTVSNEFVALTTRIDRLRETHPNDPQLLELHEALVRYLTAFSTVANLWNVGLREELQGNAPEAAHHFAESDRHGEERKLAQRRLIEELRRLRRKENALYTMLGIPQQTLVRLDLL